MPYDFFIRGLAACGGGNFTVALRRARIAWTVAMFAFCFQLVARAQDGPSEYQAKAIHIAKLVRYVEWPKEKTAHGVPLVIGIFGNDHASEQIKEVIGNQKINNREIVVKNCATIQEFKGCHILFVSRSEESRLGSILGKVKGDPVLTVGESDSFLEKGGIINLRTTGRDVKMAINEKNARNSGLRLSPKLVDFREGAVGG